MVQNLCLRVKSPQLDGEIPTVHGLILFNPWLHRELSIFRWTPSTPPCFSHRPIARGVGHETPRGAQRCPGADGRLGAAQPAGHADDAAHGAATGMGRWSPWHPQHRGATPELWCGVKTAKTHEMTIFGGMNIKGWRDYGMMGWNDRHRKNNHNYQIQQLRIMFSTGLGICPTGIKS